MKTNSPDPTINASKYEFMIFLMYSIDISWVQNIVPDSKIRVGEIRIDYNFNAMFHRASEYGFVVREQHQDYFVFTSTDIELCKLSML